MISQPEWDAIVSDLKGMFGGFLRMSQTDIDVEDVLQDTWMIAYQHYDPERGSLYAFCTKVGYNLIKQVGRASDGPNHKKWMWHEVKRLEIQADELAQTIEKQIRFEEWSPQWDMIQALMGHKHSMEARVLWAMYEFIIKHDEIPTLQQTADIIGVSHQTVWTTLRDVVQVVEGQLVTSSGIVRENVLSLLSQ